MTRTILAVSIFASALASVPTFAATGHRMTGEEANAILTQKIAERETGLYQEAHANYLTRKEARNVQSFYAARDARETTELANYQRFKFDQRLALAEASGSRRVTVIDHYLGGTPTEQSEPAPGTTRRPAAYRPIPRDQGDGSFYFGAGTSAAERLQHYPDRFFAQEAREAGVKSAEADSLSRESSAQQFDAAHPPAGYMTTPRRQLLDVRGYRSGDSVRDPYDGHFLSVP